MSAKGEARRGTLVRAATELLLVDGFEAVSHRAVATRAGVPLAATTYYFASLAELVRAAVDLAASGQVAAGEAVLAGAPARARTPVATARLLVRVVAGGPPEAARLLGLYERFLQAGRDDALREPVRSWNATTAGLVARTLERSGRPVRPATGALLLSCTDGVLVSALAEGVADLEGTAARRLAPVVQALAPGADRAPARDQSVRDQAAGVPG